MESASTDSATPIPTVSRNCLTNSVLAHFESDLGALDQNKWLLVKAQDLDHLRSLGISTLADTMNVDLSTLGHSGGLTIRNRSIPTRSRFPWCPGHNPGTRGFVLSSIPPTHDVVTLGPSQPLGGLFSHPLDLPCSLRWSGDSHPLN